MLLFDKFEDHCLIGVVGVERGDLLRREESILDDMVLLHIFHNYGFIRVVVWGVRRDVGSEGMLGRVWRVHHLVWYDVYTAGIGEGRCLVCRRQGRGIVANG